VTKTGPAATPQDSSRRVQLCVVVVSISQP
jgi:hypothetical protein